MTAPVHGYDLRIAMPAVSETAANFRLPSWPPPNDFPVVIDVDGVVVSRYGDPVWDLTLWDRVPKLMNFGDGKQLRGGRVSKSNADTFRMVAAWWLWGPRGVYAAGTLVSQHRALKSLFVVCTSNNIDARSLSRYPAVVEKIAHSIPPSARLNALSLLHALFEQRDQIGFTIMDRQALSQLAKAFPPSSMAAQTAYIPPRIWAYQIRRLKAVLDDFLIHKERLEACYLEVLNSYDSSYGSLAAARGNPCRKGIGVTPGAFEKLAQEFGIYDLLKKWYQHPSCRKTLPLTALTNFLSLANRAGFAYLLNFSLMRVQEAWTLRVNCFHLERDEKLGNIATLRGETTKTVTDDQALWITSISVTAAIETMATISRWRVRLKGAYGDPVEESNAFLYMPTCEPWKHSRRIRNNRGMYPSYAAIFKDYPKLFEASELRVTQEDWNLAKLITPTLDENTFGVGKIWRFTWHQLRRTGSVNMQASGIVSDFSLQYQLKHETMAMSLYYGQGYSQLALNRNAKEEYIRAMYEMMGKELAMLLSDQFVSPYGEEKKKSMLTIVSVSDNEKLLASAKEGRIAWRGTLFGGCTKSGPCQYGGIDNVVRCGGGDDKGACADALFDRARIPVIRRLQASLSKQLAAAENGSPRQLSLQAQLRATENALNVLDSQ